MVQITNRLQSSLHVALYYDQDQLHLEKCMDVWHPRWLSLCQHVVTLDQMICSNTLDSADISPP
jgi:hypothetical protein